MLSGQFASSDAPSWPPALALLPPPPPLEFWSRPPDPSSARMVTVNVQLAEPHEFAAVAVTVVVPRGNPVTGSCGENVMVGGGDPVTVRSGMTGVKHWPGAAAAAVTLPGHVTVGGVQAIDIPFTVT